MATSATVRYEPLLVERKWQATWQEHTAFSTPASAEGKSDAYIFVAPPSSSGDIDLAQLRGYMLADAHARFRRSRGDAVLSTFGLHAFAPPADRSAEARGETFTDCVTGRCPQMRDMLQRLGCSFDSSRSFSTGDPDVYRWSQWLFLTLLEDGLVYRHDGLVDRCETCNIVLASTQVDEDRCPRCRRAVQLVRRAQWYLKLSAYNEENDRRLEELTGWTTSAIAAQRTALGRVDGVELEAYALDGTALTVFTAYPEAIAEAAFVAVSPNHPELSSWIGDSDKERCLQRLSLKPGRDDHSQAEPPLSVETGLSVQIPEGANPLPVLICPHVDARFGSTAILGTPARDAGDRLLAAGLEQPTGLSWRLDKGRLTTRRAIRYRASDLPVSQQRAWGTPIPLVHCDSCGAIPVPVEQLPVLRPQKLVVSEDGKTLTACPDFVACTCPVCGQDARRDTETLDCRMDLAWMELPPAVPSADRARAMFSHPELSRWLPVNQFIHGPDDGSSVLMQRMVAKSLRDRGMLDFLPTGEPYARTLVYGMVKLGGPGIGDQVGDVRISELVDQFGADAVRFAIAYAANPAKSCTWNEHLLPYCHTFLNSLWEYADPRLRASPDRSRDVSLETSDPLRLRLASWCETAIRKITENFETLEMQRATRNVILMLTRIEDFERRVLAQRGELTEHDREALSVALRLLVQLLAPLSPHIAEELWRRAGCTEALLSAPWPTRGALATDAKDGSAPARR
jgi:leucyl-tRNA synthetase